MYFFKSLVGILLSPLCIALWLFLLALLLRVIGRRALAKWVCIGAAVFAWLVSTTLGGSLLLSPLERQYPPLERLPENVRFVVVLGSSYTPTGSIPITAAIDPSGLQRLVEGVRLQRLLPGSTLVLCGGGIAGREAPAAGNALLARSLGAPAASMVQLVEAFDTRGEAAAVAALTGSQTYLLVTSSGHMPRAMEYMRRAGGRAVAAPTGQKTAPGSIGIESLIPSSDGLRMSEDAIHEYLGWLALIADVH